jgi:hypothetical protein
MGYYFSNIDSYNTTTAILPRPVWESLLTFSFFFIFLDYSKETPKLRKYILQGFGILLLAVLSFLYKSKATGHSWLHFSWWEILGLIGWSYLICALIYFYSKGYLWIQAAAWLFFMFFNLDYHFGMLDFLNPLREYVWFSGNGAMQAFTMAGVFVAVLYMRLHERKELKMLGIGMLLMAVILFNLGFIVRYFSGGISKMGDTPSWVLICTAISLVMYVIFIYVVDFKDKYNWFKAIEPAGSNAFTCYVLPGLFYPLFEMTNLEYPGIISQGIGGLIKCIVFAFAMVWLAGLLEKVNIKLKV